MIFKLVPMWDRYISMIRIFFNIYFVGRASRHKFLLITNLTHFFMYLFIHFISTCFEHQVLIIRRSNCVNTSSGMISL